MTVGVVRQNLAACCEELGIVVDDAEGFHTALFDARATAQIVARLLAEDRELVAPPSRPIEWPKLPTGLARPVPRRIVRTRRLASPGFLQRLASRSAHDTEASSPDALTYLGLLDRVLEYRIVDADEEQTLLDAVERLGLSKAQVLGAHVTYLQHLTTLALADGQVSDRERADLEVVARLLGIDDATLDALLSQTSQQLERLSGRLVPGEDLRGKRVCFTGELQGKIEGAPVRRAVAITLTGTESKSTVRLYRCPCSYGTYAMADVNVTDLRQNLPAYLDRARRGERIRVISRGAVIAEITGPKATGEEAELVRKQLRGAVLKYESPTEPAYEPEDWSVSR